MECIDNIDCTQLADAVRHEFTVKPVDILQSIKLQNHIYGCFIVMEDIAQKTVGFQVNVISTADFSFDLDTEFGEIGLRYGFVMDMNLMLTEYAPEYKAAWLAYFQMMNGATDMTSSDAVEDALIHVMDETVREEDAYFSQAITTGVLPHIWMSKLLTILKAAIMGPKGLTAIMGPKDPTDTPSALQVAHVEKPLKVPKPQKVNPLQKTRRQVVEVRTKHLGTTRRRLKTT